MSRKVRVVSQSRIGIIVDSLYNQNYKLCDIIINEQSNE